MYEGEFIRTPEFDGIVKKIVPNSYPTQQNQVWVEIETNISRIKTPSNFEVFSTLNLFNISLLIELILTFLIFYLILQHTSKWCSKLSLVILVIAVLLWIYRNIFLDNLYTYSGYYNGGSTILIIIFALIFFYYQLNRPDNLFIYASPTFWIVAGILIFKAGTFFLFLYGNTLDQDEKVSFFMINSIFYVVENVFFTISFIVQGKDYLTKPKR